MTSGDARSLLESPEIAHSIESGQPFKELIEVGPNVIEVVRV